MKLSLSYLCLVTVLFATALATSACSKKPKSAPANEPAPAVFRVNFDTTRGPVVVEATRNVAPIGTDRFYNLVQSKYFDGARFFRVVPGFVVQFGMASDPKVNAAWDFPIQDDPVRVSNRRGTLTFAAASDPNTRTTQLFINLGNNERLDSKGFAVFGRVISGMDNVDHIYAGYGENPDQGRIEANGNAYLEKEFPHLDYIKTARVIH